MKSKIYLKLLTLLFLLSIVFCRAQQVYSLSTSSFGKAEYSYFKDINNEFTPYTGTWIANFQNRTVKLMISKETHAPFEMWDKQFYKDFLVVRYEISENNIIKQSTFNKNFQNDIKYKIESTTIDGSKINLVFSGGNCSIGLGNITFQKIDNTHFNWSYFPKTVGMNDIDCPPNQDYNIYLPITQNLIFTKQ